MPPRYTDKAFMARSRTLFTNWCKAEQEMTDLAPEQRTNFSCDYFRWQLEQWLDTIHTCPYCHKPVNLKTVTLDHCVPKSRGGAFTFENIVFCCRACNRFKGALTKVEFEVLLRAFQEIERIGGQAAHKALTNLRTAAIVGLSFRVGRGRSKDEA